MSQHIGVSIVVGHEKPNQKTAVTSIIKLLAERHGNSCRSLKTAVTSIIKTYSHNVKARCRTHCGKARKTEPEDSIYLHQEALR